MNGHQDPSRREFLKQVSLAAGMVALTGLEAGADEQKVKLGIGASFGGKRLFPDDNPWNQEIAKESVDLNSDKLIASIGKKKPLHPDFGTVYNGAPNGIPYIVVSGKTPKVPIEFEYKDESDEGPYPIPKNAPIEGGPKGTGDRHVLVVNRDNWKLHEVFSARPVQGGWKAGSGAIFDLNSNKLRPAGWTSADAAGLPILPGLVRYDEVMEEKAIRHALRFTIVKSRRGYVHPARHFASRNTSANVPPMGMRVRLKADYDISKFPREVKVILTCLKTYGMIVADNGGDWFLSGAPDKRWDDDALHTMKKIKGEAFEVVKMGEVVTRS
jgi:hypothetical protein